MVEREDERKRGQSLLPSGQVSDVLPRFLGRANAEHDAFAERVQRVHQLQLRVPAQRDHLVTKKTVSRGVEGGVTREAGWDH